MKSYDKYQANKQSKHSRKVTIGHLKAQRLIIKNIRRAKNGLPPKSTYAEI